MLIHQVDPQWRHGYESPLHVGPRQARSPGITSARCDVRVDDELVLPCCDADNGGDAVTVDIGVEPNALEVVIPGRA